MLGHELVDEGVEGLDAVLGGAAVEDTRPAGVPGGQVAEGAHPLVLVLDLHALAGRWPSVLAIRLRAWIEGFSSAQTT